MTLGEAMVYVLALGGFAIGMFLGIVIGLAVRRD
jgi:hypothetical protein